MTTTRTVLRGLLRHLSPFLTVLAGSALSAFSAGAAVTWSSPSPVNNYAAGDFYADNAPRLATDGQGNWVAVWEFVDFFDREIYFSRSSDNGHTWSDATALNTTAFADGTAFDILPDIATDSRGNWLAVWSSRWNPVTGTASSDYDLLCARSSDNGVSWSPPVPVNSNGAADGANDFFARVTSDRNSRWVITWSAASASPQRQDVLTASSSDNGASWNPVVAPSAEAATFGSRNIQPRLATNGSGVWVLVSPSNNITSSTTGSDYDVIAWRSLDNGQSWSDPLPINGNSGTDTGDDRSCDIAVDRRGTWMAAWETRSILDQGSDYDIAVAHSFSSGASWEASVLANSTAYSDTAADTAPFIAAHPFGGWMLGWTTNAWNGTDTAFAWAPDNGLDWSSMAPLNDNAQTAGGNNALGALVPGQNGDWIAVWRSTDLPTSSETDSDVFFSRTTWFTGVAIGQTDRHDTGGLNPAVSGYAPMGFNIPGLAHPEYRASAGAYLAHIAADATSPTRVRVTGAYAAEAEWLPYSFVGPDRYVRAKYHLYTGGQANPAARNTIPNLRIRAALRFAQTSILDVYNHMNGDPSAAPFTEELRPSSDPARPSIYRVDLDPVDVPYLQANAGGEGVMRAFEGYSTDPQDNGFIAMTESSIGSYLALLPNAGAPVKVYAPGQADAGSLAATSPAECTTGVFIPNGQPGVPMQADPALAGAVSIMEGAFGVTLDTTAVPANRIGIACREFFPGSDVTAPDYVRVEENRQYLVRFHLTSAQASSDNAQIRCRARTVKWNWVQRFEIGGAWAIGTNAARGNAAIAQQSLPGLGCLNPEQRTAGEAGGWYTLLMYTPLSPDIRPEIGGTVGNEMPNLASQPGPGEGGSSFRDLKVGLDLLDTISPGPMAARERGNVTVDRIEVYSTQLVQD